MKRTHAVIVGLMSAFFLIQPASAYLFPYDDQEYALCGWGGSCQGWFYPSQYYTRFEPDPRQYERVETYPMGYADVAPEWQQQAMNWVQYGRVNPAFTWGDTSGGYGGYGDPTVTYTHPYDGYYSPDHGGEVYGIDPSYYSMQYQYYQIAI
ncbi:MAG: hypothetical protein RI911_654 [Candidatus Parcubacteria bacterium]|jgi:hypothetical protein